MEKGLCSTASSVLSDFDSTAQLTLATQTRLSEALHRLNQELDRLLEDAPAPFTMQYAGKICGVRKRVSSLNSLLGSVQRRLDNIDRLISLNGKTEGREHSEEDHAATNTINGSEGEKGPC